MIQLLTGYELDQGFVLQKSEPSVFDYFVVKSKRVGATNEQTINLEDPESKHLVKYTKFRSKEELDFEIKRLLDEIKLKQVELAYVENMMFAVSESSSHQSDKYQKENNPGDKSPSPLESNNNEEHHITDTPN